MQPLSRWSVYKWPVATPAWGPAYPHGCLDFSRYARCGLPGTRWSFTPGHTFRFVEARWPPGCSPLLNWPDVISALTPLPVACVTTTSKVLLLSAPHLHRLGHFSVLRCCRRPGSRKLSRYDTWRFSLPLLIATGAGMDLVQVEMDHRCSLDLQQH